MLKRRLIQLSLLFTSTFAILLFTQPTAACGGLFCMNNPVDQNAERIIFTENGDGTISAIIQIQYTGFDEDFSWILPLPEAIAEDAIAVPETAANAFTELEIATNPVFIPPPVPECAQVVFSEMIPEEASEGGVEVFAEGEVGPYGFVVIGSDDPDALINWLRDNNYRVEPPMEPLIDVYVEEEFVFLAMRLLPEQGVQDIQPIQVTYPSDGPMIPLRLTAVAATADMAVLTWFFGEEQAVPVNYGHFEVPDDEITFFTFGGNNYRQLMGEKANEMDGQAFITEYAAPTSESEFADPLLQDLSRKHRYLTRLNTVISPEEMTLDPVFKYEKRDNVFNVHDLSNSRGQYDCEREEAANGNLVTTLFSNDQSNSSTESGNGFATGVAAGVGAVLVMGGLVGAGVLIGRRSRKSD